MVIAMFGGWTGRPIAGPMMGAPTPATSIERQAVSEIACGLRRGLEDTVVLTVTCPEVSLRKTVYPDGRTALEATRGPERVTLATTDVSVTVVRSHRTATVNTNTASEDDLIRFREPLVASGAIRSLRALAAAIEDIGQDALEHLAVRLTGALVAQYDGDCGAIPRLSRELLAAYTSRSRRVRGAPTPHRAEFRRLVLRASRQLQAGMESYTYWNPVRQGYAFTWMSQVEAAWHACVHAEPDALPHGTLPSWYSAASYSNVRTWI